MWCFGAATPTGPNLYAKARYYDSEFGRFTSQDSYLGETDSPPSLHRYLYAYARPTFFVDPTGHMGEPVQQPQGDPSQTTVDAQTLREWEEYAEEQRRARGEEAPATGHAPEPQIVEEETPGIGERLWNWLTGDSVEQGKEVGEDVERRAAEGLNVDRPLSEHQRQNAVAMEQLRQERRFGAGPIEGDAQNLTQGDRGGVRKGAATGLGAGAAALASAAFELGKAKVVQAGAKVAAAGARLKNLFRRSPAPAASRGTTVGKWTGKDVGGRTAYQRNDILDPEKRSSWQDPTTGQWKRGSNVERMGDGLAPVGHDGKPVNLHHVLQAEPGPVAEVPASLHRKLPHKLRGAGESFRNDPALKQQFEDFRSEYWKQRSKDFISGTEP